MTKITKKADEARLTYTQFEQFLKLLATQCYTEGSDQGRLKILLSHMRISSDYNQQFPREQHPLAKDSDSSSASMHSKNPRYSDITQTRSSVRLKVSQFTKKMSLTSVDFSKVLGLQHIYQPQIRLLSGTDAQTHLRHRSSAGAFATPKSTTFRDPYSTSTRLHTRHESVPEGFLSQVKDAVRRFEGQVKNLGCGQNMPMKAAASFMSRLHRRRIEAVSDK